MQPTVFAAVLLGAALHAGWNAVVKGGRDTLLTTILLASASGIIAVLVLPFVAQPAPASWPYLAASTVAQVVYFLLVAAAYRAGDMSQVYPLMRGTAPVLVAIIGAAWLGEPLPVGAWLGVALISAGVLGLAVGRRGGARPAVIVALANALVIATYTLIDGAGVRLSGAPAGYAMWLFVLNALPLAAWALATRRAALFAYARTNLPVGLIGGLGNLGSYGLALWAMTRAPIATVAALRETAILFAMAIAALVLREPIGPTRLAAAVIIVAGAASLRLA